MNTNPNMNTNPITHAGVDRCWKVCKCSKCGIIAQCIPIFDFYGDDNKKRTVNLRELFSKRLKRKRHHTNMVIAMCYLTGTIAQMAEHEPFKLVVAGSIPARPTIQGNITGYPHGSEDTRRNAHMKKKPRFGGCTLPPVVGSPNSDTPRVTNVLAGMVEPLAKANSSEEFTAALKDALQRLIAEAKKLERENIRQDKKLENAFVVACERSRRGWIDKELYACLGIDMDRKDRTSNPSRQTSAARKDG